MGQLDLTAGDVCRAWSVVRLPIFNPPLLFSITYERPEIFEISIMYCGLRNLSFINGTRLSPPAKTLAPSPYLSSKSKASSTVRGAKYSNSAGLIELTPLIS
jgi:hypothetical protein